MTLITLAKHGKYIGSKGNVVKRIVIDFVKPQSKINSDLPQAGYLISPYGKLCQEAFANLIRIMPIFK